MLGDVACALVELRRMRFGLRVFDGRIQLRAPADPTDEERVAAEAARVMLRAYPAEALTLMRWPPESWEFVVRFGHEDALLYPFLGRDVDTPSGRAVLQQVTGGRAVVLRPGASRTELVHATDLRPLAGVTAHAG